MTHDLCGNQKNKCLHPFYSGSDGENYKEKFTLQKSPKFIPQVFIEKVVLFHILIDLAMQKPLPTGPKNYFISEEHEKTHLSTHAGLGFQETQGRERKQ